MSTQFNPQDQNTHAQPKKKAGLGKKILLGGAGAILVFGLAGACTSSDDSDSTPSTTETQVSTQVDSSTNEPSVAPEPIIEETTEQPAEEEASVSREYSNALKKAESYLDYSHFSYSGLYKQLTSEYADEYPADAAQYAVDNVEVDWNEEAVEAAESYLEYSEFSSSGLYDQLISEYGEGFTPEQAQYAVDTVY